MYISTHNPPRPEAPHAPPGTEVPGAARDPRPHTIYIYIYIHVYIYIYIYIYMCIYIYIYIPFPHETASTNTSLATAIVDATDCANTESRTSKQNPTVPTKTQETVQLYVTCKSCNVLWGPRSLEATLLICSRSASRGPLRTEVRCGAKISGES